MDKTPSERAEMATKEFANGLSEIMNAPLDAIFHSRIVENYRDKMERLYSERPKVLNAAALAHDAKASRFAARASRAKMAGNDKKAEEYHQRAEYWENKARNVRLMAEMR